MSKLKPSTRVCALSIVLDTSRDSIATSSSRPSRSIRPGDAVRREPLHQVVVEREVEARRARVALAGGAAAELVVDPAALVALGADDVQAARRDHLLVVHVGDRLRLGQRRVVGLLVHLGRVEVALVEDLRREPGRVAAELDVRAAAGHVGGDRDVAAAAGLRDDRPPRARGTWR